MEASPAQSYSPVSTGLQGGPHLVSSREGRERQRFAHTSTVLGLRPGQWCSRCWFYLLLAWAWASCVISPQRVSGGWSHVGCAVCCPFLRCFFLLVSPFPPICAELLGGPWWRPRPGSLPGVRVAVLSFQDLGVTKVGHMKRILCGIKELNRSPPATEA